MQAIPNFEHADKMADRSVNPAKLNRQRELDDFATRAAQSAFRGNYVPPAQTDFCDRAPGEIAILRALHCRERHDERPLQ